jgi:hypothetical protein
MRKLVCKLETTAMMKECCRMEHDRLFPEKEVAQLLRRAMELDALRQTSMSAAEIKAIAEELGTPAWAVDQAIAESSRASNTADRMGMSWRERLTRWQGLPVLGAVQGAAIGVTIVGLRQLFGGTTDYGSLGVMLTAVPALVLAGVVGGKSRHKAFQKSNVALWSAFGLMALLGWPSEADDILMVIPLCVAGSGIVGSLVVEWLHRRRMANGGEPGNGETRMERAMMRMRAIRESLRKISVDLLAYSERHGSRQAFS